LIVVVYVCVCVFCLFFVFFVLVIATCNFEILSQNSLQHLEGMEN